MKKMMRSLVCLILFAMFLPAAAYALDSVVNRSFLPALEESAERGDSVAQFNLGVLYHNGQGVRQDYKKSAEWLEKSARQGNANAALNLFVLYHAGEGIEKDDARAAEWCRKAAEGGNVRAQLILSALYRKGEGVSKDERKATEWFMRASNGGNTAPDNSKFTALMLAVIVVALAGVFVLRRKTDEKDL